MKRISAITMIIFILASMTACKPKQTYDYVSPLANTDTTVVKPPVTEILPVEQMPLVTVSLPVSTESKLAADGNELLRYTYQNMFLILPDSDVGEDVIVDFLSRRDPADADLESLLDSAEKAYNNAENWTPYIYQVIYEPIRIDYGVLSLLGRNTVFNGSSHPETSYSSLNYDLVTGNVLSLEQVLSKNTDSDTIASLVIEALNALNSEKQLYDGYETAVTERFSGEHLLDNDWYFSNDGLTFYFSPYEIAPYSSGVIHATIPYEKLAGILDDAYFPAEKETAAGALFAELFSEEAVTKYTQFAEVVLDKSGDKTLLHTDHYIQDLRIRSGSWSADGSTFTPENTVFAAYGLTKDDAIMLESALKPAAPTLQITYITGEDTVTAYLSGTSGSSVTLK